LRNIFIHSFSEEKKTHEEFLAREANIKRYVFVPQEHFFCCLTSPEVGIKTSMYI
jgi:hypothetical protein